MAKFTDYNLRSEIYTALEEIRFTTPTKVQERLIPVVMQGRSVVGQSQTGSGKTHTFLIPIFQKYDPSVQKVQAVITTPSRELAQQIYAAAKQLGLVSQLINNHALVCTLVVLTRRVNCTNWKAHNHKSLSEHLVVSRTCTRLVHWISTRLTHWLSTKRI